MILTALLLIGGGTAVAPASAATADEAPSSPSTVDASVAASDTAAAPESVTAAAPAGDAVTAPIADAPDPEPTEATESVTAGAPEPAGAQPEVVEAPGEAPVAPAPPAPVAESPTTSQVAAAADPGEPTVSVAFADSRLAPGERTRMTLTFTNAPDLQERFWQLLNRLPRPVQLMWAGNMSSDCITRNWAPPSITGRSLSIGNLGLGAGMASCSFSVDVVAGEYTGTFTDGASRFDLTGLTLANEASVYIESFTVEQSSDVNEVTAPGQVITYSTTVTNVSAGDKSGTAPLETEFSGEGQTTPSLPASVNLSSGQSQTFTSTYTVTAADIAAGGIRRVVTAIADPDPTEVQGNSSEVTVRAVPAPALSIQASTDRSAVSAAGDHIVYTVVLTNTGNVVLSGVAPFDTAFSGTGEGYPISGSPARLAPGQSATFVAGYVVSEADIAAGGITATFSGAGNDPSDERIVADEVNADVSVAQIPVIPATPVTPDVPTSFVPDASPAPAAAPAGRAALAATGGPDMSGAAIAAMLLVAAGAAVTIRRRRSSV